MDNSSGEWIKKESSKHPGKMYYFNTMTGESSWHQPKCVKAGHILIVNKRIKEPCNEKLLKVKEFSGVKKNKTPAQDRLKRLRENLLQEQKAKIEPAPKWKKEDASLVNENVRNVNKEEKKAVIKLGSSTIEKNLKSADSNSDTDKKKGGRKSQSSSTLLMGPISQLAKKQTMKRTRGGEGSATLSKVPRLAVEALCKIPKLVAGKLSKFKDKFTSLSTSGVKTTETSPENGLPKNESVDTFTGDVTIATRLKHKLGKFTPTCKSQIYNVSTAPNTERQALPKPRSANERLQNLRKELESQRKILGGNDNSVRSTAPTILDSNDCSAMDWEEIEEQINEKISEIRQDTASNEGILEEFYNVVNHNLLKMAAEQSKQSFVRENCFHFVVDTNVLLRNLSFIEDLKKLKFGGAEASLIVVPYCVLQELDRIKTRSNQAVSTLAVRAIKYLNEKFEKKDENVKGQSAFAANNHLIKIENADDNILNCCLQIKEKTNNILLLTNDVNLRNKAICNNILVSTKADLEAADLNQT